MDEAEPMLLHEGVPVIDLAGRLVGRVATVGPRAFDVTLTPRAARTIGANQLHLPVADIIDADDHEVTLREELPFLARPELRPDPRESAF